jgi:peroxiredoxin
MPALRTLYDSRRWTPLLMPHCVLAYRPMPIPSIDLPLGTRMPWFRVIDLEGRTWTTEAVDGKPVSVIAFLSRHSPYVKHIEMNLGATAQRLLDQNVLVLGISTNDARAYPSDGAALLNEQARRAHFTFPYATDADQQAAKAFRASCTPEFFVYDKELRLIYHGQYDDSRPDNDIAPSGNSVLQAVDAALKGEVVSGDQPTSLGCSIKWRAGNEPSYVLAFSG